MTAGCRLPLRQPTAHRAGHRSRHRDDDAAKGAVKPVYQLMADAGEPFDRRPISDQSTLLITRAARCCPEPFNTRPLASIGTRTPSPRLGLDPESSPRLAARPSPSGKKLKAGGGFAASCPAWISWTQIEPFNAWPNLPLATQGERPRRIDTELNSTPVVGQAHRRPRRGDQDKAWTTRAHQRGGRPVISC